MSYGLYPSGRWGYDIDRSRVYVVDTVATEVTGTDLTDLNALASDVLSSTDRAKSLVVLLPDTRRLTGIRVYTDGGGVFRVGYSATRVAPADILTATWTDLGFLSCATSTTYRYGIQGTMPTPVGAIRLSEISGNSPSAGLGPIHLFGPIDRYDRVSLWDASLDQPLLGRHFEWRDAPQGSGYRYPFRVRNLSDEYTATDVVVSVEDVGTPSSPGIASQILFSEDDDNYYSTITLDEIEPLSASGVLWVACEVSVGAELGLWPFRVRADVSSWS